jgi:glycosyltransferase involved in cell wall biosynthesis
LLFEPGDPGSISAILERILSGETILPGRAHCAQYARAEFRWDRPADAIERAFDEVGTAGWPGGLR